MQGDGHDVGRVVHVADPGGSVAPDTPDAAVQEASGLATTNRSEFGDPPPDYHSGSTVLADETRLSDDMRRTVRRTGRSVPDRSDRPVSVGTWPSRPKRIPDVRPRHPISSVGADTHLPRDTTDPPIRYTLDEGWDPRCVAGANIIGDDRPPDPE